jgi:surfeit locus 1 family protein
MAASPTSRRHQFFLAVAMLVALATAAGLVALGNWQLERRVWKLGLIERVTARVDAAAQAAPGIADWPDINRDRDEYRHIRLRGEYLSDATLLAKAVTELGSGYWVMTPLRTEHAGTVMVNRGYIDQGVSAPLPPEGPQEVTGLLRLTEPEGAFLRDNLPEQQRWYSRDVEAMANALNVPLAPYFVDAKTAESGANAPVSGLTVVTFHNSHMVYALTWYALAAMVLAAAAMLYREAKRRR